MAKIVKHKYHQLIPIILAKPGKQIVIKMAFLEIAFPISCAKAVDFKEAMDKIDRIIHKNTLWTHLTLNGVQLYPS